MPKVDDTNVVPEVLTAPWVKRFFKKHLGIPVQVKNAGSQKWVSVWINPSNQTKHWEPLVYNHQFPAELGNRCMRLVYRGSPNLCEQFWGGNITAHSIAMYGREFRELLVGLIESPIVVDNTVVH